MPKTLLEEIEADLNREKNEQATEQLAEIWYGNPFTKGKRTIVWGLFIIAVLFGVTSHYITAAVFGVLYLAVIAAIGLTNKGIDVNRRQ